ncbi:MAG TPA: hypothetical protein VL096_04165 [Pirellulaceae bacterium]|nr:hypothetical protein [Pirellulaceae bacterium]
MCWRSMFGVLFVAFLGMAIPRSGVAEELAIELAPASAAAPASFVVQGLSQDQLSDFGSGKLDAAKLFAVRVSGDKDARDLPAIAGKYQVRGATLAFQPRFALQAGLSYQAHFALGGKSASRNFTLPSNKPGAAARVVAVYPSATTLPENQLKFYLHFSAPMSRGEAYSHVRLLKKDGMAIDLPFLEIGEELWDRGGQRLTLLIDPGRIKRGVTPREEIGPVFEAGQSYTLVIDKAWHDANGEPLAAKFEKRFQAGPPIESALNSDDWKLTRPAAGTRDPLIVRFPRALDRALLERTLMVSTTGEQPLAGEINIADEEHRWEFVPKRPWSDQPHRLVVDAVLEDLAGNRLGQPFEVDQLKPIERTVPVEKSHIRWQPQAAN